MDRKCTNLCLDEEDNSTNRHRPMTEFLYVTYPQLIRIGVPLSDKKGTLSQEKRAMPQLFFSVSGVLVA